MSNKTQLQTNNNALDALIVRVNAAKNTAASLPSAGGGSGGAVETCTVTVSCESPTMGVERLFYVDETFTLQERSFPDFGEQYTITVMKNSILCSNYRFRESGNAYRIEAEDPINCAYFIFGDAILSTW